MAITRPPEVLTVFCVPVTRDSEPTAHLFAVFDSHPRPQHNEGAAFILLRDADVASEYLAEVLAVDPTLYQDGERRGPSFALTSTDSAQVHCSGKQSFCPSSLLTVSRRKTTRSRLLISRHTRTT